MATQYTLTQLSWAPPGGVVGTVTMTVTDPTGATTSVAATTGSPQNPGAATAWFTPQLTGTYSIGWTSSSGQTSTTSLVVAGTSTAQLMTLNDCYDSLKLNRTLQGSDANRDADMLFYARAAATLLERRLGPISPTTITEVFNGGIPVLRLRAKPTAILSVTQNGTIATGWVPDFSAGLLFAGAYGAWFTPGVRNVQVIYTAGSGQVKPNVLLGIRETFRQIWERSRSFGGGAEPGMVLQGFAVPAAVWELVGGEDILPGFA